MAKKEHCPYCGGWLPDGVHAASVRNRQHTTAVELRQTITGQGRSEARARLVPWTHKSLGIPGGDHRYFE